MGRGRYVFLDSATLASRRLFPDDDAVLLSATEYPAGQHCRGADSPAPAPPTQWLVYRVVRDDTDKDGTLDAGDLVAIGVSDADGGRYSELLPRVEQLHGVAMPNASTLVVAYTADGAKTVSSIDLPSRAVTATKPIVDLGPNVR